MVVAAFLCDILKGEDCRRRSHVALTCGAMEYFWSYPTNLRSENEPEWRQTLYRVSRWLILMRTVTNYSPDSLHV
jgi:hypothetical protein